MVRERAPLALVKIFKSVDGHVSRRFQKELSGARISMDGDRRQWMNANPVGNLTLEAEGKEQAKQLK